MGTGHNHEISKQTRKRRCSLRPLFAVFLGADSGPDKTALERSFAVPPDAAKPRVWWHWTGGNVTKEGITKDLEWMKRVGIGGAHVADIGTPSRQSIERKIVFFTPEWLDALRHAAAVAG